MTRRLVSVVGGALLLVPIGLAAPASASHGNGLHWIRPTSNMLRNVTVVDRTGSAGWASAIQHAIGAWNAGLNTVELVYAEGSTGGCALGNRRIEICLGGVSKASWSYNSYSHLTGAVITFYTGHSSAAKAISCHEIGHTLGLRHRTDSTSSCMTSRVSATQIRPTQHDFENVDAQHRH